MVGVAAGAMEEDVFMVGAIGMDGHAKDLGVKIAVVFQR